MNSPKLPSIQRDVLDTPYDDIEQALLELTTASLDEDGVPAATVDEFALEFMIEDCRPPSRV